MDFSVSVSKDEFDSACKIIKKNIKGKKPFDLTLCFHGSTLRVSTSSISCEMPITGEAEATIIVPGQTFRMLQGTFPIEKILHLGLSGSMFKIERLSLPCKVIG